MSQISEWRHPKQILIGALTISILSCYLTVGCIVLSHGPAGLLTDFRDNGIVIILSCSGCLLYHCLSRHKIWPWIPTLILFVLQSILVVRAKPPSEWVYALPSYGYSLGSPILSLLIYRAYLRRIKIRPVVA